MKKFLSLFLAVAIMLSCLLFLPVKSNQTSSAYYEASPVLVSEIKTELTSLLTTERIIRPAGSEGEKDTLDYILNTLSGTSGLVVLNDGYFSAGKQLVSFENSKGFAKTTYNVGVQLKSANPSAKTLSIITNVDNVPLVSYKQGANGQVATIYSYTEAVNESAGTISMMLALAKYLADSSLTFDFNINFVFCGAGAENNAGANAYKRALSADVNKNQLVLCLNKITVGDYNYFYTGDYSSNYSEFAAKYLNSDFGFRAFDKTTSITSGENGNIAHAGMEGAAGAFYNTQFNLISVFSGNYNGFASIGKHESQTHTEITYTENDTTSFIEIEYKRNVASNLGFVASAILNFISGPETATIAFKPHNNMAKINFANNEVLALTLTGAAVILIFVVYYAIYSALLKKSKKHMNGEELASVVMHIIGEQEMSRETEERLKEKIKDDAEKDGGANDE